MDINSSRVWLFYTDDFDLIIYDGVKNGYFDEDELHKQADVIKARLEMEKSQVSYHDAWDLYRDSFQDNKVEVVTAVHNAFEKHYEQLSLSDLNSVVILFRTLDESDKADKLINLYLEYQKSDLDKLAYAYSNGFFGEKVDSTIKQKIEDIFKNNKQEKTLKEIFLSIAIKNSWSQKEQRIIEQASAEDIYQLLKENLGDELRKIIKFGFMLANQNTREAMVRIRNENTLNKLRTDKYFKND